jgi:gentisate 1,2-dioxygenase
MNTNSFDVKRAIDALYSDLTANDLQPLWTQAKELVPFQPKPATLPWLWRWETLLDLAQRAGDLITVEQGGERRVLILTNPGLRGRPFAAPTMMGTLQYLNPKERAPAHRHTASAIRFVLQGDGISTTVDGDKCEMHPGDLIVTPNWSWHDHYNEGDVPAIWFDGLDDPTGLMLDAVFFEPHEDQRQQVVWPFNATTRLYAMRGVLPLDVSPSTQTPLFLHRRADTDAALTALLEVKGGPMVSIQYINPTTAKSALPTLGCEMHRLLSGTPTRPYRKVGNSLFVVYQGTGYSVIEGQRFDWHPGDMFVVPSWAITEHYADETADLFAVTDRPILEALSLFRESYLDQAQAITSYFKPK